MGKLKPVAYMHYFFAGSPPDDYYEDFELIKPCDIGRYKDIQSNEAEGVVPLYAIPEGYSLVPDSTTSTQKFRVNGEFSMDRHVDCHDCNPGDVDPECEECNGEGSYYHKQVIPWAICKDIYYAMIKAAKESAR